MDYFYNFRVQEDKLAKLLAENSLLHEFIVDRYPMALIISQDTSPDAQMALYEQETDGVSSRDSRLVLMFPVGDVSMKTRGRIVMSDDLYGKIKRIGKNMVGLYLHGAFAQTMERSNRVFGGDPVPASETGNSDNFQGFFDANDNPE